MMGDNHGDDCRDLRERRGSAAGARQTARGEDRLYPVRLGEGARRAPLPRRGGRLAATVIGSRILIEPTAADINQAWADYAGGFTGSAGIVDHVSFTVMRRLGRTEAF